MVPAEQVKAALEAAADFKDKLLRALADMENLRKRTEREVADARQYGVT
jgi:molecular chaperone GrpE